MRVGNAGVFFSLRIFTICRDVSPQSAHPVETPFEVKPEGYTITWKCSERKARRTDEFDAFAIEKLASSVLEDWQYKFTTRDSRCVVAFPKKSKDFKIVGEKLGLTIVVYWILEHKHYDNFLKSLRGLGARAIAQTFGSTPSSRRRLSRRASNRALMDNRRR